MDCSDAPSSKSLRVGSLLVNDQCEIPPATKTSSLFKTFLASTANSTLCLPIQSHQDNPHLSLSVCK